MESIDTTVSLDNYLGINATFDVTVLLDIYHCVTASLIFCLGIHGTLDVTMFITRCLGIGAVLIVIVFLTCCNSVNTFITWYNGIDEMLSVICQYMHWSCQWCATLYHYLNVTVFLIVVISWSGLLLLCIMKQIIENSGRS